MVVTLSHKFVHLSDILLIKLSECEFFPIGEVAVLALDRFVNQSVILADFGANIDVSEHSHVDMLVLIVLVFEIIAELEAILSLQIDEHGATLIIRYS